MGHGVQKFQSLPFPVKIALVMVAYFALGRLGFLFSVVHSSVSLVWPSTGLALAALILFGWRLWPGIALGAFLVNLSNGTPPSACALIAIGNTIESLSAVYLLGRVQFGGRFERIQSVIGFVALAVVVAPLIGATVGVAALCLSGVAEWTDFGTTWWVWWAGDAMGALIIAPALLTWGSSHYLLGRRERTIEAITLYLALAVISALVFATQLATSGFYPLAYLTFPFLVWAAFRFGAREVATSTLLMGIVAAWGTTQQTGPFVRASVQESLIFAGSYIGTMSVTALLLAAAIGERKRSEASLRQSQARLHAIVENLPFEVWVRDLDGRCVLQNSASVALWGDILGKGLEDMGLADDVLPVWQHNNQRTLAGESLRGETEINIRGQQYVFDFIAAPIRVGNTIQGILGTNIDITERKQAEAALRESEARFRSIFERSSVGILVVDRAGYAVSVNPAFERMVGYTEAEMRQMPFRTFTHPDDLGDNLNFFERLHKGEIDHYQMDKRYLRKDGGAVWTHINVSPISNSNNPNTVSVALVEDISERTQAEAALRASEARFRAVFEGASLGIALFAPNGYPVSVNPALQRMLGYSETELLQRRFRHITHLDDVEMTVNRFQQLQKGEIDHYQMDKRYLRKDGGLVWSQLTVYGLAGSADHGIMAVALIEDITTRKLAEDALRESEARFRAIFEGTSIGIAVVDRSGYTLSVNLAFERMLGYPETELLRMRFRDYTHPDDVPDNLEFFQRLVAGQLSHYQYDKRYVRKDGGIVWVRMNVSSFPYQHENMVVALVEDITQQKQAENALHDLNVELERRVAERTAELAAANERLTELDRLKSKFIADVSHELRTPLAVLNTSMYLVEKGLPEKRAEYLIGLHDQIQRLIQFVNTVLDLSRLELGRGKVAFGAVNLNEVIEQVTGALAPRAEASGLRLTVHCADDLPPVRGEFNQLAQVATNLTANAINYTANGRIEVSTRLEGRQVCLRVRDTGMGIAPDDLPHLFERFYRGERAGQTSIAGSGLGLSIVKEIVDLHAGTIQVESQVGQGSTFIVLLPFWEEAAAVG